MPTVYAATLRFDFCALAGIGFRDLPDKDRKIHIESGVDLVRTRSALLRIISTVMAKYSVRINPRCTIRPMPASRSARLNAPDASNATQD